MLVLVAVFALWGTAANAQIRLGVKGGFNYTNWKFGQLDLKNSNKNGFFFGPTLKINFPTLGGFGLNVSGLYDQRKVSVGENEPVEIKSKMVAFPVNLQFDLFSGSALQLFIYAGPEFDFNLNGDEKVIDQARTWKFKDSGFSLNAGAGVLLLNCLQLSLNYNLVCGSTADVTVKSVTDDVKSFKTRANAGHVAVAIFF